MLVDARGVVALADDGVSALLGIPARQCVGQRVADLMPWRGWDALVAEAASGVPVALRAGGPLMQYEVTAHALWGGDHEVRVGVLLTRADEEGLRETRSSVHLRTTIVSVISGFAHEVRNPIAAVLSITEVAMSLLPPGSPAEGMLRRVPALVNRIDKLIKESLRYSRPRVPKRSAVRVVDLIEGSVELAAPRVGEVEVVVERESRGDRVHVDIDQIEQALVNLLCNARAAARGRVSVTARRLHAMAPDGDALVALDVTDDGGGIAVGDLERIFEPFFTTKAEGTGLGLAIARELVRLNGGDLVVSATSPSGTTFTLLLPETREVARP